MPPGWVRAPSWQGSKRGVETLGRGGEQLRGCREVPVRRGGIDVAEVGRQQRQPGFNLDAGGVPVEHAGHGEAVTEVPQARPTPLRAEGKAGAALQADESRLQVAGTKPRAGGRDEQARCTWRGKELISSSGVGGQCLD